MVRDVCVCLVVVVLAALLGLFVHPLLWSVAILAVAWLLGRDPAQIRA